MSYDIFHWPLGFLSVLERVWKSLTPSWIPDVMIVAIVALLFFTCFHKTDISWILSGTWSMITIEILLLIVLMMKYFPLSHRCSILDIFLKESICELDKSYMLKIFSFITFDWRYQDRRASKFNQALNRLLQRVNP